MSLTGTAQAQLNLQPLFAIDPGSRSYLTTDSTQRGVAYNPLTGNILVVNRAGELSVNVLDGLTGADKGKLDVTGISSGAFALNQVVVAADGKIYAANLVVNNANTVDGAFRIYRWDTEISAPQQVYAGELVNGTRWGDGMDIRGAGNATQILVGQGAGGVGNRIAVFTTADRGRTLTPTVMTVVDLTPGDSRAVAFGRGNTFFAKNLTGTTLNYGDFVLSSATASILTKSTLPTGLSGYTGFGTWPEHNLLAAIDSTTVDGPTHNVYLFDVLDPANPLVLDVHPLVDPGTANPNAVGATDFVSDGRLVVLATNNGLRAYDILPKPYGCGSLSDLGLVAWWKGDRDALDLAGGNHGTLQNGASFAPAKVGAGFSFRGLTNGALQVTNPTGLDPGSGSFSVELWARADVVDADRWQVVVCRRTWRGRCDYADGWWLGIEAGSRRWGAQLTSVAGANVQSSAVASDLPVTPGQPTHLVFVADRSANILTLYVNGIAQQTVADTSGLDTLFAEGDLFVGYELDIPECKTPYVSQFDGVVDELSVYHRPLADDEIAAIYAAGSAGKCVPSPPNILLQPKDETIVTGQLATLTVTAAGTEPLSYHWYIGASGDTSQPIADGTLANYTTPALTQTTWYWVQVRNAAGSADSQTATVTVVHPPTITQEPADGEAPVGSTFTFTVTATGTEPLSYQWLRSDVAIEGANASQLVMENVQPDQAGTYRVRVTNPYGSALSRGATLRVDVCTPQPTGLVAWWQGEGDASDSVGVNHGTVQNGTTFRPGKVGQDISFDGVDDSVEVPDSASLRTGTTGAITIEFWANFDKVPRTANFADSMCLLEKNNDYLVEWRADLGKLQCTFTDNIDVLYHLGYNVALPSLQPGAWHHYAITASEEGSSQPAFRFFLDGMESGQLDRHEHVGSRLFRGVTGNLRLGGRTQFDVHPFAGRLDEVSIFNRALTPAEIRAIYESGAAGLCLAAAPPAIVAQPQDQTVAQGQPASFTVTPGGPGPFSYQWRHDGIELLGPNAAQLAIPSAQATDAGAYSVVVANGGGAVLSTNAVLTVLLPPTIVTQPVGQTIVVSNGVALSLWVEVSGPTPYEYQWFKNDLPLSGGTASQYVVPVPTTADAGLYKVRVTNPIGETLSAPARVRILTAPKIAEGPKPASAPPGGRVEFKVVADGTENEYQWRHNGQNIEGATNETLVIEPVRIEDAGLYTVVVRNEAGVDISNPAELIVLLPAEAPGDNFAQALVLNGLADNPITTTNTAATRETGEPYHAGKNGTNSIWFRWTAEANGRLTVSTVGSAFDTLLAVYTGTTLAGLDKTEVASDEDNGGFFTSFVELDVVAGWTYSIAADGLGDAAGRVVLSWGFETNRPAMPVIVGQPDSVTATAGSAVRLEVEARGEGLSYQWWFRGAPLDGETASALDLPNLGPEQVGSYRVIVTNAGGVAISDVAEVEIGDQPDVRSYDKYEDLWVVPRSPGGVALHGGPPGGSSVPPLIVTPGQPRTQIINTETSTTQQWETDRCEGIGGHSRWITVQPTAAGTLAINAVGARFRTVMGLYEYAIEILPPQACSSGGRLVLLNAKAHWTYALAIDSEDVAAGTVQLEFAVGAAPVVGTPPPTKLPVPQGEQHELRAPKVEGWTPPLRYQWSRDGVEIPGATSEVLLISGTPTDAGIYTVRVDNIVDERTIAVADVFVDVPEGLGGGMLRDGVFAFSVAGTPGQAVRVGTLSENVMAPGVPSNELELRVPQVYRDPEAGLHALRFYRIAELPLYVTNIQVFAHGAADWRVGGGRTGERYLIERSDDGQTWEPWKTNTVQGADYKFPASPRTRWQVKSLGW